MAVPPARAGNPRGDMSMEHSPADSGMGNLGVVSISSEEDDDRGEWEARLPWAAEEAAAAAVACGGDVDEDEDEAAEAADDPRSRPVILADAVDSMDSIRPGGRHPGNAHNSSSFFSFRSAGGFGPSRGQRAAREIRKKKVFNSRQSLGEKTARTSNPVSF